MEDRGSKMEGGETGADELRLFVAIVLPNPVKDEIEKAQRELRDGSPGNFVRWTKREQFHLTLKFLGNVSELRVPGLNSALREACMRFSELQLRAERIGFFPDMRFPRVIWVGVHDETNALSRLQSAIETAMAEFTKERPEKRFIGHLTLGRIQRIKRPEAEALAKFAGAISERYFGEWTANKVELIHSELSSGGSRYTTLADIPLSGRA